MPQDCISACFSALSALFRLSQQSHCLGCNGFRFIGSNKRFPGVIVHGLSRK
jgi:hypothetical protein